MGVVVVASRSEARKKRTEKQWWLGRRCSPRVRSAPRPPWPLSTFTGLLPSQARDADASGGRKTRLG